MDKSPPFSTLRTANEISTSITTYRFTIVTEAPALGATPPIQVLPSLKFEGVVLYKVAVEYDVPACARARIGAVRQRTKAPNMVKDTDITLRRSVEQ
jgi:hypothetical protein